MLQALQIRIQRGFFSPALKEGCFICSSVTWFASWPQTQSRLVRITHRNRPGSWDDKSTQVSSLSTVFWIKFKLLMSPNPSQPYHPSSFLSSHPSAFTSGKDLVTTLHLVLRATGFWSNRDASGGALVCKRLHLNLNSFPCRQQSSSKTKFQGLWDPCLSLGLSEVGCQNKWRWILNPFSLLKSQHTNFLK